jgi:hypothetical protein
MPSVRKPIDGTSRSIYGAVVATEQTPSQADRDEVKWVVLGGLQRGESPQDIWTRLRPYADYAFPFPGDALIEIGAGALSAADAAPATPVSLADATVRHLPEWPVSGNTARQKHRAAMQAAIAAHAGIVVDYDEVAWSWQVQDFAMHAFEVAVVLVRVAAEHTGRSVASICGEIAARGAPDHADHGLA